MEAKACPTAPPILSERYLWLSSVHPLLPGALPIPTPRAEPGAAPMSRKSEYLPASGIECVRSSRTSKTGDVAASDQAWNLPAAHRARVSIPDNDLLPGGQILSVLSEYPTQFPVHPSRRVVKWSMLSHDAHIVRETQ